ncbi:MULTISPECIES: enoyl-CoA hydratase [Acinetobacter]|uniref:enoyl-CoA hydratase n=1 Tax=Acinetobacter TaxID=469 RepID=UPI00029C9ECB|nr:MULTISPECIES: enoyl-CoA hydratase [Acinetobacter]EKU38302.1 enoyl-CoA hydratase/isomerase family protein [Acinetobacter sp. WC-141]MBM7140337.1 enoyl-CoA hydratase [Acinetobacter sp. 105-3]
MQQDDKSQNKLITGTIQQHLDKHILTLTMSNPAKKNAINYEMYATLSLALDEAATNQDVHVVVLTGEGSAFTSGNDVNAFETRDTTSTEPPSSIVFLKSLATFPKPIIAKVNGVAIGIGSTMLLHCDLVYASQNSIFQFPFVNLGLVPEAGSSYILPRLLGFARASEIILLGEKFSADQAKNYGLVNEIFEATELDEVVEVVATKLAHKPSQALQLSKKLLRDMPIDDLLNRIDHESTIFSHCLQSPEFKEALSAFQEKRKPNFHKQAP